MQLFLQIMFGLITIVFIVIPILWANKNWSSKSLYLALGITALISICTVIGDYCIKDKQNTLYQQSLRNLGEDLDSLKTRLDTVTSNLNTLVNSAHKKGFSIDSSFNLVIIDEITGKNINTAPNYGTQQVGDRY